MSKFDPNFVQACHNLAKVYLIMGKYTESKKVLEKAKEINKSIQIFHQFILKEGR